MNYMKRINYLMQIINYICKTALMWFMLYGVIVHSFVEMLHF